jgi:alkanesulfonate monooxygenase SsuD/methylene tetrahydromethanopterin reductase-like flavin-dependent oxidoreductase (luciferase family)
MLSPFLSYSIIATVSLPSSSSRGDVRSSYYRYPTVSVWPGLIQRPHPPLYSTGYSFESATFAARQGHGLALSFAPLSYVAQVIPHYRAEAARQGWEPRDDQIIFRGNVIATDTDEEAQQLATQLATLPHLKRPQSPPATASPNDGERKMASAILVAHPVVPPFRGEIDCYCLNLVR